MATTCKLIAKNVLGSNSATVTFSSIPGTYTDLLLLVSPRGSSTNNQDTFIGFNSSTSNFSARSLYASGSTVGSGTPARYIGAICGTNNTANTFGSIEVYIPNYTGSTNKSYSSSAVMEDNGSPSGVNAVEAIAGLWSNTAAITSIELSLGSGNFVTNSSFFLYGITKSA